MIKRLHSDKCKEGRWEVIRSLYKTPSSDLLFIFQQLEYRQLFLKSLHLESSISIQRGCF